MLVVPGFYVTLKSLFSPLYQILSAITLYSSAELDSTPPPKYIIFFQHFTFIHILTSSVMSLPSLLPSESRESAKTNCSFHSSPIQHAPPSPPPVPAKQIYWLKLASLVFCLFVFWFFFFSALWPYYFCIFKAEDRHVS